MKSTYSLVIAALLTSFSANAGEIYFFSPNGAGDMDGTSWENAAAGEDLAATVSALEIGDMVCIQAGSYKPDRTSGGWDIPQGVTIRGGYPATMTGTDTNIVYPTGAETIFSADVDGDGVGDNGTRAFFWIFNKLRDGEDPNLGEFHSDYSWRDYKKTTISGITIRDAKTTLKSSYRGGAVYAFHANVEFDNVKFINNAVAEDAAFKVIGGVVQCTGCYATFRDCVWRDNKSTKAGVALTCRQPNNGTTVGAEDGCTTILDRCVLINNTVYAPSNTSASYGGAIALADNGGTMYMVNTTVTGSSISWAGAGARIGTNAVLYDINNTWYDCTCTYTTRYSGSILSVGTGGKLYTTNNIAVNKVDNYEGMFSTLFLQAASTVYDPRGYNVWGSLYNATTTQPNAKDNQNKTNTMDVVFGTNTAQDVNGKTVIAPLESFRGSKLSDIVAAAQAWNLPADIDVTVDVRGYKRPENTIPGCYDVQATATGSGSGIAATLVDQKLTLTRTADGAYVITGAEGLVNVYDLSGRTVHTQYVKNGGEIDLNAVSKGIYIVRVADKAMKISK